MKRKSLDNVPLILNTIISDHFMKITEKDEEYQDDGEVTIEIESPPYHFEEASTKTMNDIGKNVVYGGKNVGKKTEKSIKLH